MQWALVGAKRLECGSSLPLSLKAQTTCLEPYRHDAANNVSVPISAFEGFPQQTSAPGDWNKGQPAGNAAIRMQDPDNEPVTLFASLLDVRGWQAVSTQSIHLPTHLFARGRGGAGAALDHWPPAIAPLPLSQVSDHTSQVYCR
ncbi:MAG TPA: hypothetical protein PLW35_00550 [Verrucomicrobiota bacterium]|nr:hypothetical protein [Verrucomicrobiota bacterium]